LANFTRIVLCIALLSPSLLYAQPTAVSVNSKSIEIKFTDTPPIIDGIIDDAVWKNAAFVDDLHQINPVEYATPSERTEIYMLYDADALYVAVRLYNDPEDITDNVLRRNGNVFTDDNFVIDVDLFNNQRTRYFFGVNANGVRVDEIFQNITQPDNDWTAFSTSKPHALKAAG